MTEKLNDIKQLDRIRAHFAGKHIDAGRCALALRTNPPDKPEVEARAANFCSLAASDEQESPADEAHPIPLVHVPTSLARPPSAGIVLPGPHLDVAASFIAQFASPASRRTMLQGLERCARMLDTPFAGVPWETLRFEHTSFIRGRLLEPGRYERRTVASSLAALRGVLKHAWGMGLLSGDELQRAITWPKLPKREDDAARAGRELTQEDLDAIRGHWERQGGAYGAFLGATFALLLGTGLRASEVCRLPAIAIDFAPTPTLRVLRKGNKKVVLPLGLRESQLVAEWLPWREELSLRRHLKSDALLWRVHRNDWVRSKTPTLNVKSLEYLCDTLASELHLKPFTPHDLRRTFATRSRRAGLDLRVRQWLMSHEDSNTTAGYDMGTIEEFGALRREVDLWSAPKN